MRIVLRSRKNSNLSFFTEANSDTYRANTLFGFCARVIHISNTHACTQKRLQSFEFESYLGRKIDIKRPGSPVAQHRTFRGKVPTMKLLRRNTEHISLRTWAPKIGSNSRKLSSGRLNRVLFFRTTRVEKFFARVVNALKRTDKRSQERYTTHRSARSTPRLTTMSTGLPASTSRTGRIFSASRRKYALMRSIPLAKPSPRPPRQALA